MVLDRASGERTHTRFDQLPEYLRSGDRLVLNETRVLPARLYTKLERTGRDVEVLLCHPSESDRSAWIAMLGPSRRLRQGDRLELVEAKGAFSIEDREDSGLWRIRPEGSSAEAMMDAAGHLPLPPYLGRDDGAEDRQWYQTVFAETAGAVAAPTAGLHFTDELFERLDERGVGVSRVVLHVGPGTFLPVRAESVDEHAVLAERFEVSAATASEIEQTRAAGGRIVAVGTTVVRTLESTALRTGGALEAAQGWAGLTIVPGHEFARVDALVTNFHLPKSSLLLLVSALAGRVRILEAYEDAVRRGYRFYSYGDAMLIC